jgi:hypothetical protein
VKLVAERLRDKSVCIYLWIFVFYIFLNFIVCWSRLWYRIFYFCLLCICSYLLKSIQWRDWLKCIEFLVRKAVTQPV